MAIDRNTPLFTIKVDASEFKKALENATKGLKKLETNVNRSKPICPKCNREINIWDKRENYKGKVYHYNCLLMKVDKKGRSKDLLMKRLY